MGGVKVVRIQTGDPQVAKSCLGGCLLMIGWVVVGVTNAVVLSKFDVPGWEAAILGIMWFLSAPIGAIIYLKWRGRRHTKAFEKLEGKMLEKSLERLRKQSPEDGRPPIN